MTTDVGAVRDAYLRLAGRDAPAGQLSVADTSVTVPGGSVVLALDPSGHRCVLVPSDRSPQPDKASRGVSLSTAEYMHPDLDRTRYLVLRCEMGEFEDLFASIASEVLRAIEADSTNAEKACYAVLGKYRDLFGPPSDQLLGPRALAALFAELVVLSGLVSAGGHVGQWRGPERGRHDFVGPGAAIEVKSTLSSEHRRIVVHGTRQLEPPPDRRLFVHLVRLEPMIGGRTVQDLVDEVIGHGADPAELRRRLGLVGYEYLDAPQYQSHQFSVLESETHEVDDNFPRLAGELVEQLPPGISDLTYTLDLGAAGREPFVDGLASAIDLTRDLH